MHDQHLPVPCLLVHTRSQSIKQHKLIKVKIYIIKWCSIAVYYLPQIPVKEWLDHPETGIAFHFSSCGQFSEWSLALPPKRWWQSETIEESGKCREVRNMISTLKGPLSVLKLMPGTYFNHTGNPLSHKINAKTLRKKLSKHNWSMYGIKLKVETWKYVYP